MKKLEGAKKQGFWRRLFAGWKRIAKKIGDFQARILLIIFYFVILMPFALIVRLATDPLAIKKGGGPRGWVEKELGEGTPSEQALKQF